MVHTARHWLLGFIPGVLLFVFGLFELIGKAAWLGFFGGLAGNVLAYLLAIGGIFMIMDSFFEYNFHSGAFIITFVSGAVVMLLGIVNVLHSFNKIAFSIPLPAWLYQLLFVVEGALLVFATFVMD